MKLRTATAIGTLVVALGGIAALGSLGASGDCGDAAGFVDTAARLYRASVDPHPLFAGL